jgi:hypothetical protein
MYISVGELAGTEQEVTEQVVNDQRHNHLSNVNNRLLANLIIDTIDNYQPGLQPIDLSKFESINPNAHNWPQPGFGTK